MKKKMIFAALAMLVISGAADARKVRGHVMSGMSPLGDVIVTDGQSFTKTRANGSFKLDIADDAWFVYVVTPSGYTGDFSSGAPCFYQKAEGKKVFDFNLQRTSDTKDYTLFSVSDPQVRNKEYFASFCAEPLSDLVSQAAKYSQNGPVVGVNLGDIAWDNLEYHEKYKAEIKKTGIPFYNVIGNHDNSKVKEGLTASEEFRDSFGPLNWAFCIGDDVVIGLNNIIYDANRKYDEGYTETELNFLKGLLEYIPADKHLYIAQHCPVYRWTHEAHDPYVKNAEEFLSLIEGRHVDILSGHTHIMNNVRLSDTIVDHNAASICGSWWKTIWCNDGTPRGYEIFTSRDGKLEWFYHPVDFEDDFQVSIMNLGESIFNPNSVIANIWDYDEDWTVTWSEDGVEKGEMLAVEDVDVRYIREILQVYNTVEEMRFRAPRTNIHYFAATPSQYAKSVKIKVQNPFGKVWEFDVDLTKYVDVQAHRGGAGLMPENTFSAMENAIRLGVNTLEMDFQISADDQIVVSHDAWFHERYATRPDGTIVLKGDPKEYIYTMPYDSVAKYDVGIRKSAVWPDKAQIAECKPLAIDLIQYIERMTDEGKFPVMRYNIEIKSRAGKGEGKDWPDYRKFADLCCEFFERMGLGDRLVVQSFDVRALEYVHEKYPDLILSYLVDKKAGSYEDFMSKLSFTPQWLSPEFTLVDSEMVEKCHRDGMRIVPWTVDKPEDIKRILETGVDSIISNYPDRVLVQTRGFTR